MFNVLSFTRCMLLFLYSSAQRVSSQEHLTTLSTLSKTALGGFLTSEWKLDCMVEGFKTLGYDGDMLINYAKPSDITDSFKKQYFPMCTETHWRKLWYQINEVKGHSSDREKRKLSQSAHSKRRFLSNGGDAESGTGLYIRNNMSAIVMGTESDVVLRRTARGALSIENSVVISGELLSYGSSFACKRGWTGEFCNETCTDISYYVMGSCMYNDGHDAGTVATYVPFSGFYRPNLKSAAVQCCTADTCTRYNKNSECLIGSFSTTTTGWYKDFLVDYDTASNICKDIDQRLCTSDELLDKNHDCCASGCGYDFLPIWTSTVQFNCNGAFTY